MVVRSFANTAVFNDFVEALSFANFERVPKNLALNLKTGFSVRATLAIENVIKTVRCTQKRHQESKVVSVLRRWLAPIQRRVVTNVLKHTSVDHTRQVVKGGRTKRAGLPRGFFRPPRKNGSTSLNFRSIVSTSSAPSWVSWSSETHKVTRVVP
jgi:hypothetical protein